MKTALERAQRRFERIIGAPVITPSERAVMEKSGVYQRALLAERFVDLGRAFTAVADARNRALRDAFQRKT